MLEKEAQEKQTDSYKYISSLQTKYYLESFGYGESKMLLDAFYFDKENQKGVGVLQITDERCKDHNGIFRGIEQIEAMAQTCLMLNKLLQDKSDQKPIFLRVVDFNFILPVTSGSLLNIFVNKNDESKIGSRTISKGKIQIGEDIVSYGSIEGTTVSEIFLKKIIEREKQKNNNRESKFLITY